ncbi:SLC13 family permease [Microbacterium sp. No. 7]|uniref:SLC13 family permease n=1 Tax=Microbacterium sp. No. 7 TaxID=1714373 RepID=UPI000A9BF95B|nr:SLC13 family permease [Microbacterium sp. No. 7]
MSLEVWSVVILLLIFVVGTTLNINLGFLALLAAFVLGFLVMQLPSAEVFAMFPASTFLQMTVLMVLLAIMGTNGTIDWLMEKVVALTRGRHGLMPIVLFLAAAILAPIANIAAIPILAGIGARYTVRYGANPLLTGLAVVHGTQTAAFFPIAGYNIIARGIVEQAGFEYDPWIPFVVVFVFNTLVAAVGFILFGGLSAIRRRPVLDEEAAEAELAGGALPGTSGTAPRPADGQGGSGAQPVTTLPALDLGLDAPAKSVSRMQLARYASLVAFAVLLVLAGILRLDLALAGTLVTLPLLLLLPSKLRGKPFTDVPWHVLLLLSGMIVYVGVMEAAGAVQWAAGLLGGAGGLVAILIICYIAAILSAFASSLATMTIMFPIAFAVLGAEGASTTMVLLVVAAIGLSATVVDVSPFSIFGALALAPFAADKNLDHKVLNRQFLGYAGGIVVLAPGVAWLLIILPAWMAGV